LPKRDSDRTVTRSFRISEHSLKALEDEAKKQNIGVSTLLNQQLIAYGDFERFIRRIGLIKISSATFQKLLEAGSDKQIARAGVETGSDTPRSIILAMHGVLTLETVIDYLKMLSEFAGLFEFGEVDNDGKREITLLHRLGSKGSIFFANYMKSLFEGIGYSPSITSSQHSVLIEILPKKDSSAAF
jgi:hypothetical protein